MANTNTRFGRVMWLYVMPLLVALLITTGIFSLAAIALAHIHRIEANIRTESPDGA